MKFFLIISIIFLTLNCSKSKTVLICGDHVCVNKSEAEQYFEENLSIEVKIIDNKKKEKIDLVELNLKDNSEFKKKISIESKNETNKEVKILTNDEIKKIKRDIKKKKSSKNIFDREIKNNQLSKKDKNIEVTKKNVTKNIENDQKLFNKDSNSIIENKHSETFRKNVNKRRKEVVDVCTIIEKCSIDEISKYLLKEGKNKSFPDITTRE